MFSNRSVSIRIRSLSALVAGCAVCFTALGASKVVPITTLTLIPDAQVVDAFEAMDSRQIDVRMAMANENEGKIFFTNKTDKPLTVAIPKAIAGVHVHPQMANFFGNNMGMQNGGMNQMGNGMGMSQGVGGNAMGAGQNGFPNATPPMNNNLGNGNNFFSIPPEKMVQLNFRSLCLNYGLPEPHLGLKYRLVKVESVCDNPALKKLLENYSPRSNRDAQQAAAWHLANGLSWEQIANLNVQSLAGLPTPLFDAEQIASAKQLVEQAKAKAGEPATKKEPSVVAASARK